MNAAIRFFPQFVSSSLWVQNVLGYYHVSFQDFMKYIHMVLKGAKDKPGWLRKCVEKHERPYLEPDVETSWLNILDWTRGVCRYERLILK